MSRQLSVLYCLAAVAALVGLVFTARPARADKPNRAGLVVQVKDGQVITRCVEFDEDKITGAELLARSDLDSGIDASHGLGITVCQIEGQGCAYPVEPCFCQCMGGESCAYWNYYYREPGESTWTYAALGALLHHASPGSLEAWVWGDGRTPPAASLSFDAICAMPSPTPAATAIVTVTRQALVTPVATVAPAQPAVSMPAATAPAELLPQPTPAVAASGSGSGYWLFGVMAAGLILAGAIVWLKGRQG